MINLFQLLTWFQEFMMYMVFFWARIQRITMNWSHFVCAESMSPDWQTVPKHLWFAHVWPTSLLSLLQTSILQGLLRYEWFSNVFCLVGIFTPPPPSHQGREAQSLLKTLMLPKSNCRKWCLSSKKCFYWYVTCNQHHQQPMKYYSLRL